MDRPGKSGTPLWALLEAGGDAVGSVREGRELSELIRRLDGSERFVADHWGMVGTEIASCLGVTPGRVSQIRARVVVKLRTFAKTG
jgi:DNA-directed RNA polymerase specialized sigma subunit